VALALGDPWGLEIVVEYHLKIAEETVEVAVSSDNEQSTLFTIQGEEYHVRYQAISENSFQLVVNGKAMGAFVTRGDQGKHVFLNGQSFFVQDTDRLEASRSKRRGPEISPGEITPPMPSLVVRILVEEGDRVKQGQGLVVVSAMKMETTLVSPSNGRVIKINTSIDAKVAPGDILVEIEEEEPDNE